MNCEQCDKLPNILTQKQSYRITPLRLWTDEQAAQFELAAGKVSRYVALTPREGDAADQADMAGTTNSI